MPLSVGCQIDFAKIRALLNYLKPYWRIRRVLNKYVAMRVILSLNR